MSVQKILFKIRVVCGIDSLYYRAKVLLFFGISKLLFKNIKEIFKKLICILLLFEKKQKDFLTFFGAKKEAKKHPPIPSPSLYGRDVAASGRKPPSVRILVWLAKPVPYGRAILSYIPAVAAP